MQSSLSSARIAGACRPAPLKQMRKLATTTTTTPKKMTTRTSKVVSNALTPEQGCVRSYFVFFFRKRSRRRGDRPVLGEKEAIDPMA